MSPRSSHARRGELGLGYEVSRRIAAAETPRELLDSVCDLARSPYSLRTAVLVWQSGSSAGQELWRAPRAAAAEAKRSLQSAARAHSYFVGLAEPFATVAPPGRARFLTLPLAVGGREVFGVAGLGFATAISKSALAFASALANQLAIAVDRLEQQRGREELVSMITHELKNASLALRLTVHATVHASGAERTAALRGLELAAKELGVLVSDLEGRAQRGTQRFGISAAPTALGELAALMVRSLQPLAEQTGVRLSCRVEPGLPTVRADAVRLSQVLANLIGNAVRFTPAGGAVVVHCKRLGSAVQLAVQDAGPGVSPEVLERLFEPARPGREPGPGGSGLGLSIAKGIVEAHGGELWLERRRGRGARFVFSIPFGGG